uniref:Uncharacterized protein n=1 Tax=Amazona collaria TaxID=241587 RepID=A0A8B9FFE8_9PSIT
CGTLPLCLGGSGKLLEVSFLISQLAPVAACPMLSHAGCSRDAGTAVGPVTEAVLQNFQDGCFLRQNETVLLGRANAKSKGKVMFIQWECLRQPSSYEVLFFFSSLFNLHRTHLQNLV